ncbi:MAG: hypothetical protein HOP12_10075, partial [Candidatus Eisenbacteria bacterium]|nr:hypothetical protein [Candidatus Eisenbacteria bacterium]
APARPMAASAAPVRPLAENAAPAALAEAPPLDAERAEALWSEVLVGVMNRKPLLGAFLSESVFRSFEGDALVIAMDDLHRAVVDEKDNRAIIAIEVSQRFGRDLRLSCVPQDAAVPRRASTLEEVKPQVDRAIAWFDGEVIKRPTRGQENASS